MMLVTAAIIYSVPWPVQQIFGIAAVPSLYWSKTSKSKHCALGLYCSLYRFIKTVPLSKFKILLMVARSFLFSLSGWYPFRFRNCFLPVRVVRPMPILNLEAQEQWFWGTPSVDRLASSRLWSLVCPFTVSVLTRLKAAASGMVHLQPIQMYALLLTYTILTDLDPGYPQAALSPHLPFAH